MKAYLMYQGDPIEDEEEEIEVNVDYTITSRGSPPHMGSLAYPGDPGDPVEWEIESVECEGYSLNLSDEELERLYQQLDEKVCEIAAEPDEPDYDYSY